MLGGELSLCALDLMGSGPGLRGQRIDLAQWPQRERGSTRPKHDRRLNAARLHLLHGFPNAVDEDLPGHLCQRNWQPVWFLDGLGTAAVNQLGHRKRTAMSGEADARLVFGDVVLHEPCGVRSGTLSQLRIPACPGCGLTPRAGTSPAGALMPSDVSWKLRACAATYGSSESALPKVHRPDFQVSR